MTSGQDFIEIIFYIFLHKTDIFLMINFYDFFMLLIYRRAAIEQSNAVTYIHCFMFLITEMLSISLNAADIVLNSKYRYTLRNQVGHNYNS